MHDEVGIAPDRRREMGIPRQIQTEMADVARIVDGLRLRPQDHLVDQLRHRHVLRLRQHPVESAGLHALRRQLDVERLAGSRVAL